MTCNSCPCRFEWPMDTLGIKRDPINCEKAWLDFAVRLLSREAVGKGKGQEAVWSERCKPHWWDSAVSHLWKNPTANPKDTKEVLLEKYMALESHLHAENRFPSELEEEATLWREGKYRELFLLTSLSSLLGKVTNVHMAVEDASTKVEELKATVNQSILSNIQNCLVASLKKTEKLKVAKSEKDRQNEYIQSRKRSFTSPCKENLDLPSPPKQGRFDNEQLKNVNSELTNTRRSITSEASLNTNIQPTDILAYAQKLLAKRKTQKPAVSSQQTVSTKSKTKSQSQKQILPKPATLTSHSHPCVTSNSCSSSLAPSISTTSYQNAFVTVSPEQLDWLLSHNTVQVMEQPVADTTHNTCTIIQAPDLLSDHCQPQISSNIVSNVNATDRPFVSLPSHDVFVTKCAKLDSNSCVITHSSISASSPSSIEDKRAAEQSILPLERCAHSESVVSLDLEGSTIENLQMPNLPSFDPRFLDDLEDIDTFCHEILNGSTSSLTHETGVILETSDNTCNLNPNPSRPMSVSDTEDPKSEICKSISRISDGRLDSMGDSSLSGTNGSDIGYFSDGSSPGICLETEEDPSCLLWEDDFLLDKFLF